MSGKRNNSIEALRFLFMIQICLWHYGYPQILSAGFLGVEFYFILSGFFLYRKVASPNAPSIVNFTIGRLSKFYFKYVVSIILAWIIFGHNLDLNSFQGLFTAAMNFISEVLMLQSTGIFGGGWNSPLWYFSVLIYGGALLYGIISYNKNFSIKVILPIIVLCFLSYNFNYGSEEHLECFDVIVFLPMTMVRGICEMSLGVLVAYLCQNYMDKIKAHFIWFNVASIIGVVSYLCIVTEFRYLSNYVFIIFPLIIIVAWNKNSWMSKFFSANIWNKLGALSYDMFLLHMIIMAICDNLLMRGAHWDHYIVAVIYFISLLVISYFFDKICGVLNRKLFLRSSI